MKKEKNEGNQVAIITKEWEITKDYIFEVAMKHGLINLDMNDFTKFASMYKPLMAIKVDGTGPMSDQMSIALKGMNLQADVKVSAIIISMSYNPSCPMLVDEMNEMNINLDELTNQGTHILWGLRDDDGISYERSVALYVFA